MHAWPALFLVILALNCGEKSNLTVSAPAMTGSKKNKGMDILRLAEVKRRSDTKVRFEPKDIRNIGLDFSVAGGSGLWELTLRLAVIS